MPSRCNICGADCFAGRGLCEPCFANTRGRIAQHDPLVKTHVDLWHNGAFHSLEDMLVSLAVHLAGMREERNLRLAREVVEKFDRGGVMVMSPEENRFQRLDTEARDILKVKFPGCDSFWEVNTPSELICEHPKLDMERAVRNLNRTSVVLNAVDTGGLYALFAGKCGYEGCGRVYYCIRSNPGERIVVPATMPEAPWFKPPERPAVEVMPEIP